MTKRICLPTDCGPSQKRMRTCFEELSSTCDYFSGRFGVGKVVPDEFYGKVAILLQNNGWSFYDGKTRTMLHGPALFRLMREEVQKYVGFLGMAVAGFPSQEVEDDMVLCRGTAKGSDMVQTQKRFVFELGGRSRVYTRESAAEEEEIKINCAHKRGLVDAGMRIKIYNTKCYWTVEEREKRERKYGHEIFNVTMEDAWKLLTPSEWPVPSAAVFAREIEYAKVNKTRFMEQFHKMQRLEERLGRDFGVVSIRSQWLLALSAKCERWKPGNWEYVGCGCCMGCWNRWCQAVMLIKSASGVSDESVVMHFGAVFKSERFGGFGIEEWCKLEDWEYASMANGCSKSVMNANHVLPLIRWAWDKRRLPRELHEMIRFYGFSMKSACLIMHAVYGREFGIACDLHLIRIFCGLGWVKETKDPTRIACTVMQWLESKYWSEVNNLFAGLGQLVAMKGGKDKPYLYRDQMLEAADALDLERPPLVEGDWTVRQMVELLFRLGEKKKTRE